MAIADIFTPGTDVGGTDTQELFLIDWTDDVVLAYERKSVTEGRFARKFTTAGDMKAAQWILTARREAQHHARGEDLVTDGTYLGSTQSTQRLAYFDRPWVAPVLIDDMDRAQTHWPATAEERRQAAEAITRGLDSYRLRLLARAAWRHDDTAAGAQALSTTPDANDLTFLPGLKASRTVVAGNDSGLGLNASNFMDPASGDPAVDLDIISYMAAAFDDNEVPEEDRVLYLNPTRYTYAVNNFSDMIDRDFSGQGSKAMRKVPYVLGFELVKTTNMPTQQMNDDPNMPVGQVTPGVGSNTYYHHADGLAALFGSRDAVGEVVLGSDGFGAESERQARLVSDFMNTLWYGGATELRCEGAGAVYTSATEENRNTV